MVLYVCGGSTTFTNCKQTFQFSLDEHLEEYYTFSGIFRNLYFVLHDLKQSFSADMPVCFEFRDMFAQI